MSMMHRRGSLELRPFDWKFLFQVVVEDGIEGIMMFSFSVESCLFSNFKVSPSGKCRRRCRRSH